MNSWLDQIILITETPGGVNENGFEIDTKEERIPVFCNVKSCKRTEFYQAQSVGVNALYSVELNSLDYSGQKTAELNGRRYVVFRTYEMVDRGTVELTLAEIEEHG
jgi:predicted nucleic-acid-binding Zn-ribbon protein